MADREQIEPRRGSLRGLPAREPVEEAEAQDEDERDRRVVEPRGNPPHGVEEVRGGVLLEDRAMLLAAELVRLP
jgi:hypothetical protein